MLRSSSPPGAPPIITLNELDYTFRVRQNAARPVPGIGRLSMVRARRLPRGAGMAALPPDTMALTGTAARVLTASYLVTLMFSMGLELGGEHEDKQAKRRQRRLLVRALLFNLIFLPAIALAITRGLHTAEGVEVALLLLAATPGGRFAPQLARLRPA